MSSSSRSDNRAPSPNARSSRKGYSWTKSATACTLCRQRKARCRLIVPAQGCENCREREVECSLKQDPEARRYETVPQSHNLVNFTSQDRALLRTLEKRTRSMQALLVTAAHHPTSRRSPAETPLATEEMASVDVRPDGEGDGDDVEEAVQALLSRILGTSLLMVSGLNIHDRTSFDSPLEAALITTEQFRMATESVLDFADRTIPIRDIPQNHFDLAQPFLQTCVVCLAIDLPGSPVTDEEIVRSTRHILDSNLAKLERCDPTTSIIAGLYLFSMAPTRKTSKHLARNVDGSYAIQKAVAMAIAAGLNDSVQLAQRQTMHDLANAPYLRLLVHKVVMWYLVISRSQWVEILSSPTLSSRDSSLPPLSAIVPVTKDSAPILQSLEFDGRLRLLLRNMTDVFARVRLTAASEPGQLAVLANALEGFGAALSSWRDEVTAANLSSSPFLIYNSLLVEQLVPFKVSTDCTTRGPTPLGPQDRLCFELDRCRETLSCAIAIVRYAVMSDIDFSCLPAFHLTMSLTPYKAILMAAAIDTGNKELRDFADSEAFRTFRYKLSRAHPCVEAVLQNMERSKPPSVWREYLRASTAEIAVPSLSVSADIPINFDDPFWTTYLTADAMLDMPQMPHEWMLSPLAI